MATENPPAAMRVHVISLVQSVERRTQIRRRLAALGCPFEFFGAIQGSDGYGFFERFDEKRYLLNTGRTPTTGEVGCYASHLYLWNLCVALDEPLVVLEDDADISPRFKQALEAVASLIGRYGFIRLQNEGPARTLRSVPVKRSGEFTLRYCMQYPFGAMGYAIAPTAAAAFIRASRVVVGPVDFFIKQSWLHGRPLYALEPAVVRGGALCETSTIGDRNKARLALSLRALRVLNKLRSTLGRTLFNLRFGPKRRGRDWSPHGRSVPMDQGGPPVAGSFEQRF